MDYPFIIKIEEKENKKQEEVKQEEVKQEEVKQEEVKQEEVKQEENIFFKWNEIAPKNPKKYDTFKAPDNTEWIFDQPRDNKGRYVKDDISTVEKESSLRWIIKN